MHIINQSSIVLYIAVPLFVLYQVGTLDQIDSRMVATLQHIILFINLGLYQ